MTGSPAENNSKRSGPGQDPKIALTPGALFVIGMLFFFLAAGIFAYLQLISWSFQRKVEADASRPVVSASPETRQFFQPNPGKVVPSPSVPTSNAAPSATPSVVAGTATATVTPELAVTAPSAPLPIPETLSTPNEVPRSSQSPEALPPVVKDRGEEQAVRQEVLRRIDLLKDYSQAEKDRLYAKVERARGFSKLAIIQFPRGRTSPEAYQVDHLLSYLKRPDFQKLFEDPTVVLVVLGYSDKQGSEEQNLEISRLRAENMVRILKTRTKISNLMRFVGMGSSDLFDRSDLSKNRAVEIWLVEP
jgi:outer membrane protein OmpA-like peptidoglycan-associated protein